MNEKIEELIKLVNYNRFITKDIDSEWKAVSKLKELKTPVKYNSLDDSITERTCYYLKCGIYPDESKVYSLSISDDIAELNENGVIEIKDMEKLKKLLDM